MVNSVSRFRKVLLVLGTGSLFVTLEYNTVMNTDLIIVALGTVLLFGFMFTFKKFRLDRAESGIYLFGFLAYMVFVFLREQQTIPS